jgi:hypothetical protein
VRPISESANKGKTKNAGKMKAIVYALIFSGFSGLKSCSDGVLLPPTNEKAIRVEAIHYEIPLQNSNNYTCSLPKSSIHVNQSNTEVTMLLTPEKETEDLADLAPVMVLPEDKEVEEEKGFPELPKLSIVHQELSFVLNRQI